ncbi:MBL fold metallo-hydrolase [Robiginitalea sp. SC105]|uniref:MBL fold metallo-hydrolase n=1 Tax=Robiginitalea sp. SC105 TaxID=2762332 RepID=UPI0016396F0E|nr:MBL fold metallo-hydrolase [Robiginitalea sp. SC105]MBC2840693.1 MBL fold metallo-hydrolase [Robiginitalea sp. SC105]
MKRIFSHVRLLKPVIPMLALTLCISSCKEEKKTETAATEPATTIEKPAALPTVHPISHATAVLEWDGTTIYIDPVGEASAFDAYPAPDLILVTDIHGDHFSPETLSALDTGSARLIVPEAVAKQMRNPLAEKAEILPNGSETEAFGLTVTAIPMYNLREEALDFHAKGRGNGYVLEKDGTRVYFSGDTEDIPEMRNLEAIDMAFVCMNLPFTMTVESAADAVLDFAPRQVYPYHYRGRPDVSDVNRFGEMVRAGNPDIEVVQLDWYPGEAY